MHTWKVYTQYNQEDSSIFSCVEFEIPDDLYAKIQKAVESKTPLCECDFYKELLHYAEEADEAEYLQSFDEQEPQREDYDDDESFQEAYEEYEDSKESFLDDCCEEGFDIYDPTDYAKFADIFIGKKYAAYATGTPYVEPFAYEEDSFRCTNCSFAVHFDADGVITAITGIYAEGLEWESERSSNYGPCYPNFDYMADMLEDELNDTVE